MIGKRYTEKFKIEAVKQVPEQGYPVAGQKIKLIISRKFQALKATQDQVYYESTKLPEGSDDVGKTPDKAVQKMGPTSVLPVYVILCAGTVAKHQLE